jgi:twinkle protein
VSTEPKAKPDFSAVERTLTTGNYQAIVDRGLTTATAKTYGIAAKIRLPDKNFYNVGNWAGTGLFGQQLFNGGGKYITICEGEFDAAAAYQMQGSKYPCVSVRNGAGGALKDWR